MNAPNNDLKQLIESNRQDAQAQQVSVQAQMEQRATAPRGKQIFACAIVAVCAVVLFRQYPRFSEPYTWPDPATNASAAEADMVEVVSAIALYRVSQGQYPAVLSQVALPERLAARVANSLLQYKPNETAYTLDWTQPHWRVSYDSQTDKISVAPVEKR